SHGGHRRPGDDRQGPGRDDGEGNGNSMTMVQNSPANSPLPSGALAGIKVIDVSRVLAGPSCTQILADHGATVIKVEPPAGDDTRRWGPPFKDGAASYYMGVNRNKRAI